jgi:uncharacterized protein (TIGR03435 family)
LKHNHAKDETTSRGYRDASDQPSDTPAAPSIFGALQQLGLKLEATQGTGECSIIDSVEKPTTN